MKKEMVSWKFHPRVFNSLGADLVTDDIVAIIELVKNADIVDKLPKLVF